MSSDRLAEVASRLGALADEPVSSHADVLEDAHRVLVSELDALAGAGALEASRRSR